MLSLLTQMVLEIVVFLVFPRYSHVQTNPLHLYGVFQIILKWSKGVTETSQYSRFSNKLQTFSKFCGRGFENRLYTHRSKALVVKVIHFLSPWLLKLENSCSFILFCHSAESQVRTNVKIFTSIPSSYETSPLYGPKKRCKSLSHGFGGCFIYFNMNCCELGDGIAIIGDLNSIRSSAPRMTAHGTMVMWVMCHGLWFMVIPPSLGVPYIYM